MRPGVTVVISDAHLTFVWPHSPQLDSESPLLSCAEAPMDTDLGPGAHADAAHAVSPP